MTDADRDRFNRDRALPPPRYFPDERLNAGLVELVELSIPVMQAKLQAMQAERDQAITALQMGGYTRCPGPAGWRPPINLAMGEQIRKTLVAESERDLALAELAALRVYLARIKEGHRAIVAAVDTVVPTVLDIIKERDAAQAELAALRAEKAGA
jgi:hypothetical protein